MLIARLQNFTLIFQLLQGYTLNVMYNCSYRSPCFYVIRLFRLFPQKISMLYDLTGMRHAPTYKRFQRFTKIITSFIKVVDGLLITTREVRLKILSISVG